MIKQFEKNGRFYGQGAHKVIVAVTSMFRDIVEMVILKVNTLKGRLCGK